MGYKLFFCFPIIEKTEFKQQFIFTTLITFLKKHYIIFYIGNKYNFAFINKHGSLYIIHIYIHVKTIAELHRTVL